MNRAVSGMISHTMQQWALEECKYAAARIRLQIIYRQPLEMNRLDVELPNVLGTLSWLSAQHSNEVAQLLVEYIEVLAPYCHWRGIDAEFLKWCQVGLKACERLQRNPGKLLLICAETQKNLGLWAASIKHIHAALEASQGEDEKVYAQAILFLGTLQLNRGDYSQALKTFNKAERLLMLLNDVQRLDTIRKEIAAYYLNKSAFDKALTLYEKIAQRELRSEAREVSDHTLLMFGVVYRKKKDFRQASIYLQQLLERCEVRQNRNTQATVAHHLGWLALDLGDTSNAHRLSGQALALYQETGDERGVSDVYEQLGCIYIAEGRIKEALSHLERSL